MNHFGSNWRKYQDDDEPWSQTRKRRFIEFRDVSNFHEAFNMISDLPPSTRGRFLSLLVTNNRLLEPSGKAVTEGAYTRFSVPEGREVRGGILSANDEVRIGLFQIGTFQASTEMVRGKEFTFRPGNVVIHSKSPFHLFLVSAPA